MSRLPLKPTVVKRLFAVSGNQCAFPNCNECMVNDSGTVIGEICHIEAAEQAGARYNLKSDDEYRRSYENLILMCSNHHKKTNDVSEFPTSKLISYKNEHEKKFANNQYQVGDNIVEEAIVKNKQVITIGNHGSPINNQTNSQHIESQTIYNYNNYDDKKAQSGTTSKVLLKTSNKVIFFLLIGSALLFAAYYFNDISQINKQNNFIPTNNDKDKVYNLVSAYFKTLNDRDADAHDFFADQVDQYLLVPHTTPEGINELNKAEVNLDFKDINATINKKTLKFLSKENNICYWEFRGDYSCYRPSIKKYQNSNLYWEFGINEDQKITSIKQKIEKISFIKKPI